MGSAPYRVEVKLKHPRATVSEVYLEAGHATPEHAHGQDYIVHPRAATRVRKTTMRNGQVVGTEEVEHKPGEPYYVAASEDGTTFTLENIGSGPMMCDKVFIHKE